MRNRRAWLSPVCPEEPNSSLSHSSGRAGPFLRPCPASGALLAPENRSCQDVSRESSSRDVGLEQGVLRRRKEGQKILMRT